MSRRLPFLPHTRGFLFILLYIQYVQTVYKQYSYSVQLICYLLASILGIIVPNQRHGIWYSKINVVLL
jgi:hypothetical protein